MTSAPSLLRELSTRIGLSQGAPTLLLLVVNDEQRIEDTGRKLAVLLREGALRVIELGPSSTQTGPARWAEASQRTPGDAYMITVAPAGPLSAPMLGRLLNAQRQDLRKLAGPLLMLLSRQHEAMIREVAPDFFTWVAQSYEIPSLEELSKLAHERGFAKEEPSARAPAEPPIRFLHLSDLHLRPGATKQYDQDRVLRGLLELLKRDRESAPLDLIFVTGDLAFSGKAAEYERVCHFLTDVLTVTGVSPEHLFLVPGNHDVDRAVGRWLLRTLDSDEASTAFFIEPESRTWHEKKFFAYREHLGHLVGDKRPLGLGVGAEAVELVEVRGERIAVASFNSAWFALDDDDRDKLWVGEANVERAGQRIRELGGAKVAIALMHHPTNFLSERERDAVEHHLERSFDIVLRGHLHRDRTRAIQSQRGGYLEIAAAAAYQGSQWPNGCFFGELRPEQRTARLLPYAFGSSADPWVLDTKVFPDDEKDGYLRTFSLGHRRDRIGLESAIAAEAPDIVHSLDQSARVDLGHRLGVTGKTSREIEEKAIQVLKQSADPMDLWATIQASTRRNQQTDAAGRIARRLSAELPAPEKRLSLSDPTFLEKSLTDFVLYWKAHGPAWIVKMGSVAESACPMALHAFLLRWVDGPVMVQTRTDAGSRGMVILIGAETNAREERAIVLVRDAARAPSVPDGLAQLDLDLGATAAAHGALVMSNASPPGDLMRRVKTPEGRDALLLCL